jgi:hypothetical protein
LRSQYGYLKQKAYDRCEGWKKFQSVSKRISNKGEGVKKKAEMPKGTNSWHKTTSR